MSSVNTLWPSGLKENADFLACESEFKEKCFSSFSKAEAVMNTWGMFSFYLLMEIYSASGIFIVYFLTRLSLHKSFKL